MTKSISASKVLQLMDKDLSYQEALNEVLQSNEGISKEELETELNQYI